jgi:ERCC4-type nuclease
MKLILDCRERELKTYCDNLIKTNSNFKDIVIETENLELGDMIIKNTEGEELIIYERKTVSDLIASIKDGRYAEQSYRLNGLEHHNHNIIYLIEGSISKTLKEKQMVYSAMFSVNYYKGFSVMRSSNIEETAYIICNSLIKIQKEKDKKSFYSNSSKVNEDENNQEEKSYSTVIKKKKNANITQENFGEIILCQIPSVNSVSAICIMKKYNSIHKLIEALKDDSNCLNDISYETEKGQKRKISKTVIKNIVDFLNPADD